MKKFLIFLFLSVCYNLSAQEYRAGYTLQYYYDIVPDTLIDYNLNISTGNQNWEDYYFDIDSDLQNDIKIRALRSAGLGFTDEYISVISLNQNAYIRYGRIDSIYSNYWAGWYIKQVAKTLIYGDTINLVNSTWSNNPIVFLTNNDRFTDINTNITDWISPNDLYIGLKYVDSTDSIFGWIRVNCPVKNKCYVKDYSFSKLPDKINEHDYYSSITMGPNPVQGKLIIQSTREQNLIIVSNLFGKIVLQEIIIDKNKELDFSGFENGFYFVTVKTSGGSNTKKIIVQH